MKTQHSSTFAKKGLKIEEVNLGEDRGVTYRLVVGSFGNKDAAVKFCNRLKAEKIGCRIISPSNGKS